MVVVSLVVRDSLGGTGVMQLRNNGAWYCIRCGRQVHNGLACCKSDVLGVVPCWL